MYIPRSDLVVYRTIIQANEAKEKEACKATGNIILSYKQCLYVYSQPDPDPLYETDPVTDPGSKKISQKSWKISSNQPKS